MDLYDVIESCICTPGIKDAAGIPLLIVGPPGCGKTSIITQVAASYGLHCETLLLSVREPTDVAGMPTLQDSGQVKLATPEWCQNLIKARNGILFLDEMTCAAPSVQAAALRIVCERVVGDTPLPKGIRIVAAANPVEQVAGGWSISPPMANRFLHYNWNGVSYDQWHNFMTDSMEETDRSATKLSDDQWVDAYARTKGVVLSFLRSRPTLLGPCVPSNPDKASGPWESPRTWEMATRIMAYCNATKKQYIELLAGLIGSGTAKEYSSYEMYADLPAPQKVLQGKVSFRHDPKRLDRTLALLTSVALYAGERQDLAPRAWEVIDEVSAEARDVAVPAIKFLIAKGLVNSKEARKALGYFGKFIKCPGVPEEQSKSPTVTDSIASMLRLSEPKDIAQYISAYPNPTIPSAVLISAMTRGGIQGNLTQYGVQIPKSAIAVIQHKVNTRLQNKVGGDTLLKDRRTRYQDTQTLQKQHLLKEIKKHCKVGFGATVKWTRVSPATLKARLKNNVFFSQVKNGRIESVKL